MLTIKRNDVKIVINYTSVQRSSWNTAGETYTFLKEVKLQSVKLLLVKTI